MPTVVPPSKCVHVGTPQPHDNTLLQVRAHDAILAAGTTRLARASFSLRFVVLVPQSELTSYKKFPVRNQLEVVNCNPMIHQWNPPAMNSLLLHSRLGSWGLVPSPRRVSTTSLSSSMDAFGSFVEPHLFPNCVTPANRTTVAISPG